MGVLQSTPSSLLLPAAGIGLAVALWWLFPPAQSAAPPVPAPSKKKGKKKAAATPAAAAPSTIAFPGSLDGMPTALAPAPVIVDEPASVSGTESKKAKKRKAKSATPKPAPAPAPAPTAVPAPAPAEEGWTRVETRRSASGAGELTTSVTGTTDDGASTADQSVDERQTLAERLAPRVPRTEVDDMLDERQPTLARVMRVAPPAVEPSFTSSDADGSDEGFTPVKSRGRQRVGRQSSASTVIAGGSSASAPETLTKRKRQNDAKRDAAKAMKADQERDRLATLERHRREREKEQIAEIYKKSKSGARAMVDENGKLIWSG